MSLFTRDRQKVSSQFYVSSIVIHAASDLIGCLEI